MLNKIEGLLQEIIPKITAKKPDSDRWLKQAITACNSEPEVIANGRYIIRDSQGEPIEFALTGVPNDDVLADMPSESGKSSLPLVLLLGKGNLSGEQRSKRLEELEGQLGRFHDVSVVRFINQKQSEVRYVATGYLDHDPSWRDF